jgi:circadian clock protein KaiC
MNKQSPCTDKKDYKTPTGIKGLDEITAGGFPKNRTTLVSGGPGCGKTILGMEFLLKGILNYGENGVFISFEESVDDLVRNISSLGYDIQNIIDSEQMIIDEIRFIDHETYETGKYDLGGLFSRIEFAVNKKNAKRIVIDGINFIFSHFKREDILRAELRRLFQFSREKNITLLVTSEKNNKNDFHSFSPEEYISDCVIIMDKNIHNQISTRRIKILKYRGSDHGGNEYPFLVSSTGLSVFPVTSITLDHEISSERISTGIKGLDSMLGDQGYYEGSSILVSGSAGTGKSSFAAHFAHSVCLKNKKCVMFLFEESPDQILRNMKSIGLDLTNYLKKGLLKIHAQRPTFFGLETHLMQMKEIIDNFDSQAVILDPISNLSSIGYEWEVKIMFMRLFDSLKQKKITTLCTYLTQAGGEPVFTDSGVSSIMDTWLILKNNLFHRKRKREVYILKSRGMSHSNKSHTFEMNQNGINIK